MSGVPIIELKKGVEIPGIPVVWDTNLSDKELAAVYQYLCKKSFFFSKLRPDGSFTVGEDGVSMQSNMDGFEVVINGKTYRGWGTPKEVTVVYRPDSDWALMNKEAKAAEDREYERLLARNQRLEQESFIKEEIAKFIQVAEKHRDAGDPLNAEKMYRKAIELSIQRFPWNRV